MIKNKLKECCNECSDIDINTSTDKVFTHINEIGTDCYLTMVRIWCGHQNVCKRYIEEVPNAHD